MSAAKKLDLVSVEDYLKGELISPIKHEYVDGRVYAMAGARIVHNDIAVNTITALRVRSRGSRCRPQNSDTKIRIRSRRRNRFYYPDASVVCRSNAPHESFQDEPVIVAEVLSESTRRIDEGEKQEDYLTISSLGVYLLIEQDSPTVVVQRRVGKRFVREVYEEMEAIIPLPEIGTELPLAEVSEDIEFVPESDNDSDA